MTLLNFSAILLSKIVTIKASFVRKRDDKSGLAAR